MYSASDIAAYFVTKGIKSNAPISQMKLQKMVFFAHGVNLAQNDSPLINESIEAWKYGPVVPSIYANYKLYGNMPIVDTCNVYDFPEKDVSKLLNDKAIKVLEYTWKATSHLNAFQLANWTHKEGSPWKTVYSPYDGNVVIDNSLIKSYFVDFLKS